MHPSRIRIRTLMIIVVVAAIPLGLIAWSERFTEKANHFKSIAAHHAKLEEQNLQEGARVYWRDAQGHFMHSVGIPSPTPKSEYHARLKEKYEEAARRPWLSVQPDPPEPKLGPVKPRAVFH